MIIENETLNAIKFFSSMQHEQDFLRRDFSIYDGGRWAMDYTALRHLQYIFQHEEGNNIHEILEFGLGVSTELLYYYSKLYNCKLTTYEHDKDWVRYKCANYNNFSNFDLRICALEEIIYNGVKTLSYKNNCSELLKEHKKELIVIDAPFGQSRYSRPQILFLLPHIIDVDNFIIFFDDTDRIGEKETIREIYNIFTKNGVKFQSCEYKGKKEHTIICDCNKKYLLSSI